MLASRYDCPNHELVVDVGHYVEYGGRCHDLDDVGGASLYNVHVVILSHGDVKMIQGMRDMSW
jgi:hypothetical protein